MITVKDKLTSAAKMRTAVNTLFRMSSGNIVRIERQAFFIRKSSFLCWQQEEGVMAKDISSFKRNKISGVGEISYLPGVGEISYLPGWNYIVSTTHITTDISNEEIVNVFSILTEVAHVLPVYFTDCPMGLFEQNNDLIVLQTPDSESLLLTVRGIKSKFMLIDVRAMFKETLGLVV